MNKLVVFDIDGTLTDSLSLYHKAVIKSLHLMGIKEVDTNFFTYKYHTDSYTVKCNYENYFKKTYTPDLLDQFENIIISELEKHPPVKEIKGAKTCVEQLLNNGFSVAFATGSLPKPAILKLQQCDIWFDKDLLATSKISFSREPFVQASIAMAKNYFKTQSFDQIYSVGDGIWDMKTAQRLHLDFIGIGTRNKDALIGMGCKNHFDDLTELASCLI